MNSVKKFSKAVLPESTYNKLKTIRKRLKKKRQLKRAKNHKRKLLSLFFVVNKNNDFNYEPLQISGTILKSQRDWEIRWSLIKEELISRQASSIIDIGCAEGWFVRRAAEDLGCFAIGIEKESKRIIPSEIARLHDDVENCSIIKAKLDPEGIMKLPICDVILCLSVVHHVLRLGGMETTRLFLEALATRAKKALIFEMGTSEEKEMSWVHDLPPMPHGQEVFIRDLLQSAGFKEIHMLGTSLSYKKEVERYLYVAETTNKYITESH